MENDRGRVDAPELQATDHLSRPVAQWVRWARWTGGWIAVLALALWTDRLSLPWVVLGGAGALAWSLPDRRRERLPTLIAAVLLWLAVAGAGAIQERLWRVAHEWPDVRAQIESRAETELAQALDKLVDQGERGVAEAGALLAGRPPGQVTREDFERLEALRRRTGLTSLAVYGPSGDPELWAGEHRGIVPAAVRRGEEAYWYQDGPLFEYLYFSLPLRAGRTAVAAVLLSTTVSAGKGVAAFADRFAERHGIVPRFTTPERARGDAVWDWSTDRTHFSVSIGALTADRWRDRLAERGRWLVVGPMLLALLVLGYQWRRERIGFPSVPILAATLVLWFVPWGEMSLAEELFSPLQFVLMGPVTLTLGELLILLVGGAVWILGQAPSPGRRPNTWLAVGVIATAVLIPTLWNAVGVAAADSLLGMRTAGGFPLVLSATLFLALPLFFFLRRSSRSGSTGSAMVSGLVATILAAALGAAVGYTWHPGAQLPAAAGAAWVIPFALFALALRRAPVGRRALSAWLAAGWIAATAVVPLLWTFHLEARIAQAETELRRLGTAADPFLDFSLRKFADNVLALAEQGEQGVNLLYRSWIASGLANEGYQARITTWSGNRPVAELRLADQELPPDLFPQALSRALTAEEPLLERYTELPSVHYLLVVPLPGGRAVSVAVPPRYQLGTATALARFLEPSATLQTAADWESLSLIPVADPVGGSASGAARESREPIDWVRIGDGWRSETQALFPGAPLHAHLVVHTPAVPLLLVRAALVLIALLAFMVVLWGVARGISRGKWGLTASRLAFLRSFRGRLTVSLFGFFLLPTLIFGAVAYGALAREVVESAAAVSQWTLNAMTRRARPDALTRMARENAVDLLLYQGGSLADAAAPEVLDLGLYRAWLPPDIFLSFASGEDVEALEARSLGDKDYLVAYRSLGPGRVLALPTPLASVEVARRQDAFRDVLLLISILGAGLSVVLAFGVGRALSRPIERLSRAAAAVGAGNLRVRLAEDRQDEFGRLYDSFNRMVDRLRRARAELLRETRRTEAIVAQAGTGVLALDGEGRVALANARSNEILGAEVEKDQLLPRGEGMLGEVAEVVERFWSSGRMETGAELEMDGRTVRLRIRRLRAEPGAPASGGAVLALEDITAEIRSARVLAWGEMARQVAHEIKNPLTPIKLSVQHLRRAYSDGKPNFGEILERNVDAILHEIDRLGEIARAFSRFGAPAERADLEMVRIGAVIEEILALYRSGRDGIRYHVVVDPSLPAVRARAGELKEVLVNLLENAREALNGGGEIRISGAFAPEEADWIELVVSDTGEGIAPELLPRIFEPQFSTRTSGTGLGLAIVRRLVESWGGEVRAESTPHGGTTVRLRLRPELHPRAASPDAPDGSS